VHNNYPGYEDCLDEIWKLSSSKHGTKGKVPASKAKGTPFLDDEIISFLVQGVIPFISGIVSSILATALYERIILDRKKAVIRLAAESKKVDLSVKLNKETIRKLLPLILDEVEKEFALEKSP